jgi:threonine/homoserine/homoserine lactone efflux protein
VITASSLVATVASAFIVTFATVVVPSPSTLAASRATLMGGSRAAAAFLSGVLLLDTTVFLVLVFGLHPVLINVGVAHALPPVAGLALVIAGIVMVLKSRGEERQPGPTASASGPASGPALRGPFLTALAVNAANPGFWLWWTTVGTSFIHAARHWGGMGLTLLLLAFLCGTVAWYLPLVWTLHKGREVFPAAFQQRLLAWFGVALVVFGIYLGWHWLAAG